VPGALGELSTQPFYRLQCFHDRRCTSG
jgi:hypothetical protein